MEKEISVEYADYFKEFSAVFEHCTANNHNFPDSDNIKLLGREGKWHKRKIVISKQKVHILCKIVTETIFQKKK